MSIANPFTERGQIRDPRRFAGRWGELSLIFNAIEQRRPAFVVGMPGIGKSSLLLHVVQSAGINMERFDLRAFTLDLAVAASEADVYRVVIEALGKSGDSVIALRQALTDTDGPVLLCLDNAHTIEGDWGANLLEELARLTRAGQLMLVVAQEGEPPILSERVVIVRLGAFATAEVRLLTEAYLEGSGMSFTPRNLNQLYRLSRGHPAYLQRAAFHLFRAKLDSEYNWVKAYLDEARDVPIPGAPLPPQVFEGAQQEAERAAYAEDEDQVEPPAPPTFDLDEPSNILFYGVPILIGLVLALVTSSVWLGIAAAAAGAIVVALVLQRTTERMKDKG